MLHEYDVVALKKELPGTAVPVLSEGKIVYVHDADAQDYIDESGKTIEVFDVVGDEHLELIREDKEI